MGNAARHELREIPMVIRPRRGLGAIEPDGQTMSCRTNGEAALPAKRGDAMVEIHLAGTMGRSELADADNATHSKVEELAASTQVIDLSRCCDSN